jgi:hypothetical protein
VAACHVIGPHRHERLLAKVLDEHALSAIGLRRLRAAAYELVAAGMNPGDVLVATGLRPRLATSAWKGPRWALSNQAAAAADMF